ncbi:MAG TPA: hypothetical protein VM658_05535 [bacterium]|nr:hypothetical protein [bacterium]
MGPDGHKDLATRTVILSLALLTIIQLALTLGSFSHWSDVTNDRPILNVDFCSQYAWPYAAREFERVDGRLWGYDPYFMAGYPLDFVFNSSLPVQLAAVALPGLSLARVVKACFILSFLLAPLVFYGALRQFGPGRGAAIAGAALGTVYFWVSEGALFGRFGMISGAFLLVFFLLPLGLLHRFLARREPRAALFLAAACALAFTMHKTAFVLLLPAMFLMTAVYARPLSWREWAALAGVVAFTALANVYWLRPFFHFLPLKIEDQSTTFFQNTDLLRPVKDLWPVQPFFGLPLGRILVMALGIIGMRRLRREAPPLFLALILLLAFYGGLAYFGSFAAELRHLQPYRYVTAFYLLWLPAAAHGIIAARERLTALNRGGAIGWAAFALILIGLLMAPSFRQFSRVAPLTTEMDGPSRELIEWVRGHTGRSARILIEDINAWEGPGPAIYGGARIPHLLPTLAPRELIGGPLPNAFILHHFASFQDGRLLNRPVADFSDADLDAMMKTYNVGWAVCWSAEAKKRFSAYPAAERAAEFGYLEVFVIRRGHDYFLEGSGTSRADYGRIELGGLATDTGRVVVSYHWVDGLESSPRAELTRVMIGGDPAGFIGVVNPPEGLVIRLGGSGSPTGGGLPH